MKKLIQKFEIILTISRWEMRCWDIMVKVYYGHILWWYRRSSSGVLVSATVFSFLFACFFGVFLFSLFVLHEFITSELAIRMPEFWHIEILEEKCWILQQSLLHKIDIFYCFILLRTSFLYVNWFSWIYHREVLRNVSFLKIVEKSWNKRF